jgi:hypothetical protein
MSNTVSIDFGPVIRAIDTVSRQVEMVSTDVGAVRSDLATTTSELSELRRRFDEFVQSAQLTANLQRSETKLSGLKDDLDRAFGHHRIVRRTSIGILQAFDIGNVSNSTVTQVSEELMIQTPRYWLAPAIVALAAWSKDDESIAVTSVQEAFARDQRKASLFFALVMRRQGRNDISVRWLRHYLVGLDPRGLGRDFAIIFEAAAQGAFGPEGAAFISERLSSWNTMLRQDVELLDDQVTRWKNYLATHRQHLAGDEFENLRQLSPDFSAIEDLLESASALPEAIDSFEATRERSTLSKFTIEDLLDEILEVLVTEYDEDELPLRREIAFHEAVVEENGDLDRARGRADVAVEALTETIDALSLQTMIAMRPDELGVSPRTQQIAIGTSRGDVESGISRFTAEYRQRLVSSITIELDRAHSSFATTFGFAGWRTTTAVPEADAISSLNSAWDDTFRSYVDANKVKLGKYIAFGAVAAFVILISLFAQWWVFAALVLVGVGGTLAILIYRAFAKSKAAIAHLYEVRDKAMEHSVLMYRGAMVEYYDATLLFAELDEQELELLNVIRSWPVGQPNTGEVAS